jgi:acyl-coenzyme A thioesterase PaaI-like protein
MTDLTAIGGTSALARIRSAGKLHDGVDGGPSADVLSSLGWVQALYAEPDTTLVAACGAMADTLLPQGVDPDHLFLSMLRQSLIKDICFLWNPRLHVFHTLVALGPDVAGHPRVTHGGFTSAVLDETTGGLVFELKKAGLLGPGPAFTARLEVDFKRPLPVSIPTLCSARLLSIEGRKVWVAAEMLDRVGGVVFATAKALYVTPRQYAAEDGAAAAADAPPKA